MSTSKQIKKLYYSKIKIKQGRERRKKSKTKNNFDLLPFNLETLNIELIFSDEKLTCCDDQSNPEQFEKAANDAMLEMLSIDPEYFYHLTIFHKTT